MEKIYYDSYEQRIRTTVWAEKNLEGNAEIHKYVRGVYIDDIFGMDEDEFKVVLTADMFPTLFNAACVSSLKELFEFWAKDASVRSGYEQIKAWLDGVGIKYEEETV
jgi:hypothetical protein